MVNCFAIFFFIVLYTNITGFRFNEFSGESFYVFAMHMTYLKSLFFVTIVAVMVLAVSRHLNAMVPFAILMLLMTSMLIVSFAPANDGALLMADSMTATGRLLSFLYALLIAETWRECRAAVGDKVKMHRLDDTCIEHPGMALTCLSSLAVMLSVFVGGLVNTLLGADSGGFALVAVVVLYVLVIVSNAVMHGQGKVTVKLDGQAINEKNLAHYRASIVASEHSDLTKRETEVLEQLLLGLNPGSIALRLSISENTAKTHIRRIYGKLGIHSRQELLLLAQEIEPNEQCIQ